MENSTVLCAHELQRWRTALCYVPMSYRDGEQHCAMCPCSM